MLLFRENEVCGIFFLLESYTQKVDYRLSKKVLQHIRFVLTNTSHWRFRGVKIPQHEKLIYGSKIYPASKQFQNGHF